MKYFLILYLLASSSICFSQREIPHLWSRIQDEAGVLSSEVLHQLENELKLYEDSTSNQIVVLVIKSLSGAVLEDFSINVAQKNGIGQKGRDNGVLLLISIDDREMRIEVGYGLEGVLTDAICSQIIRNELAPNFRRGDFDQGVTDAVYAIAQAIGGEYSSEGYTSESGEDVFMTWQEKLMIGGFVFFVLGLFTLFAVLSKGCAGWFLYFFLIPFYAAFPGVIFGWTIGMYILIGYIVIILILKLLANYFGWSKDMSTGSGGSGSSWSSGSGWSSSSGGSSFSGGGGSFGGGGSSGSW